MASEDKRDVADGATPSTSGSAIIFRKTPGEIKLDIKDTWTARILVSTGPAAGITSGIFLGTLFCRNPKLALNIAQWALKRFGNVKNLYRGSIIIELDCGSQEKYLKFQEDFKDGKVKDALEEELRKIGCHVELKLTLMDRTSTVAAIETRDEDAIQGSGETSFAGEIKKAEQMWYHRAGHHLTSCAAEVKQEWREEPHNLALFGECEETVDQRAGETSFEAEIKKAEQMWRHRAGHHLTSCAAEVKQEWRKEPHNLAQSGMCEGSGDQRAGKAEEMWHHRSRAVQYKDGVPDDLELFELSIAIAPKWERVGILLGLSFYEIGDIKINEKDKAYRMLLDWKNNTTSLSHYQDLYIALCDNEVRLNSIAKTFCLK